MKINELQKKGQFTPNKSVLADYFGFNPEDLYYKIIKDGWVTTMQHAAYIGSELRKAYVAMKKNLKYVQDEEI
jgi:hypothetical protein